MSDTTCPQCATPIDKIGRCCNTKCSAYSYKVADIECEHCGGSGEVKTMKCYGGHPIEEREECPECSGDGVL